MPNTVLFQGEVWPIYYIYGKSFMGNDCVAKAPIDVLMLGGKQYINTMGDRFPSTAQVGNDQFETEIKFRSSFGPICLGKMLVADHSKWGDGSDSLFGVHKLGFV